MIDRGPADAVRARLADPRDVARRLGFDRIDRQRGDGVLVCCPAHAERTPSCSLTRSGGTLRAKCHACGWGGDVLTLIASVRGLDMKRDFPAIVAEGAALARLPAPLSSLSPVPPPPPPITDDLFAVIVARLLGLCPLRYSRDVCAYLERRGIADEAARDGWGALRDVSARMVAEFGRPAMVASGLCVQDDEGWVSISRPASRLLIPWRDAGGRITGLQRRRIDAGEPRYVATAGRPLREPYGVDRLANVNTGPVVWVEGAIDVLALRILGIENGCRTSQVPRCGNGDAAVARADALMGDTVRPVRGDPQHECGDVTDWIHNPTIAHPRPLGVDGIRGGPPVAFRVDGRLKHVANARVGAVLPRLANGQELRELLDLSPIVGGQVSKREAVSAAWSLGHEESIAHPRPLPPSFIALALPGVEGWRSAWAAHTRGRDVYVATDADDAGDRVAVTIASDCRAAGARSVQRMRPPAKDWCAVLEGQRKV